ncbi:MAG: glycosyltransferase family 2 protein, partial [Tateyamaria sp.]
MSHVVITTMRNEGAFLLEWLAHHRAVGVDHFVVFSNDCDDGTDDMLDKLAELGWLTHVRNDGPYDSA